MRQRPLAWIINSVCGRAAVLAIACVLRAGLPATTLANEFNPETGTVVLEFEPGALIATPGITDGYIEIQTANGVETLTQLPGVINLEHLITVSTGPRPLEGPYRATILTDELSTMQVPPLVSLPRIRYLIPDEVGKLAGGNVKSWFPPGYKDMFCWDHGGDDIGGQYQLHWSCASQSCPQEVVAGDTCVPHNWKKRDHDMDLPQAWGITLGSPDVLVAVIDGGLDWSHPEMASDGPATACTAAESLMYYNNGVIFTNLADPLGDASLDSIAVPGWPWWDDDHDGRIDEDSAGRDRRNDSEWDVVIGTFEAGYDSMVTDWGRNWQPNEYAGRWLYLQGGSVSGLRVRITGNTANTIHTASIDTFGMRIANWWDAYFSRDPRYRIGDGTNNHETWPDSATDDEGWQNDIPFDDDENGAADDLHGYDFLDLHGDRLLSHDCVNEDYSGPDNNVFTHSTHGMTMASLIATDLGNGRIMGIAPGVKILPVRVASQDFDRNTGICRRLGFYDQAAMEMGIRYAMQFHPDVIVTAMGPVDMTIPSTVDAQHGIVDALQEAVDQGAVFVNGAGNDGYHPSHWLEAVEPSLIVGGLGWHEGRWVEQDSSGHIIEQSCYGPWVDLSARAAWLAGASPMENGEPTYTHESGTSMSGPLVAGVAALVKSAYPHMGRDDIIWMIERGVDNIYEPDMNPPELIGMMGSGRANAYKALTLYGNVAVNADTTWTHELWIGGDVLVPSGRTLTIAAGTTVNVAIDDVLAAGADSTQIEFVVDGTMVIQGDPSAPVKFKVFQAGGDSTEYVVTTVVCGKTFTMDSLPEQIAKFIDVSSTSGLDYGGTPYAATVLNFNGDPVGDVLVTATGSEVRLFPGDLLSEEPDVPRFGSPIPLSDAPFDCRGVAVADFDNDGDEDIFLTHATTPKLYRNDGEDGFEDVTAALGLASLADSSIAACWVDVDRDGLLDLYIVRSSAVGVPACSNVSGLQHRLFRNAVGQGGGFVDITSTSGLSGVADLAALSVCAADIDGDRDLDLFVPRASMWPGGNAPHSLLLVNDGIGHFTNATAARLGSVVAACPAAEFADIDNDSDPDLVVACDTGAPRVFLNDNSGAYLSDPVVISAPEGHAGMKVLDQDLDGWPDVLLLAKDANHGCRLFTNHRDKRFAETTNLAGLQTLGAVSAVAAADFNGDGDADLFLGKPITQSGQFLFRSGNRDGDPGLGRKYVKIRLDSENGANNRAGIGVRVKVTAGTLEQTFSPDGGCGRGGQGDRTLVFGLNDYDDGVSAKVYWPGGWTTVASGLEVSSAILGDNLNIISDDTSPTVSNVQGTGLINPQTGEVSWQITWDTDVSCDPNKDVVDIDQTNSPLHCLPGWTTINTESGLTHVYAAKVGGGYVHKFLDLTEPCFNNCKMKFRATSMAGSVGSTSPWQSKTVRGCPSQF